MWVYEKKLLYPVKVTTTDPKLAKVIITQYGGPSAARR
jgi:spore coat protein JC